MKTLVIHPIDYTTDFLSPIYDQIDCTVIRSQVSRNFLIDNILASDRVICLGHGSSEGLFGFGKLVIDNEIGEYLKSRSFPGIYIWCNADQFVKEHSLVGFYTGMFISEHFEAQALHIETRNQYEILQSNISFASAVKGWVTTLYDWTNPLALITGLYNEYSDVAKYNKERLYYNPKGGVLCLAQSVNQPNLTNIQG